MKKLIEQYRKELTDVAVYDPKTIKTYIYGIEDFCKFAADELKIDPVKSRGTHLKAWLKKMKSAGISRSRLGHHQYALQGFFAYLCKIKVVEQNPAASLPALRKVKSDRNKPVKAKDVLALLNVIDQSSWKGRRNRVIIAMLWALGLRVSELTSLKVSSFEATHDSENKIGLLRVKGKNRKQRVLFIVDRLYDELCDYLNEESSPKTQTDPLFPSKPGKAISSNWIAKLIKKQITENNIKARITPHVLRHTFATEMYHSGVPLSDLSAMMGHDNIAETSLYVHVSDDLKKTALERISIIGGGRS